MDVLQRVHQSGGGVQVGQGGFAIGAGFRFDHMHRGACGTEMNPAAAQLQVMPGVGAVQHEVAGRGSNGVLHQSGRKPQPALRVQPAAGRGDACYAGGQGVGQADLGQDLQRGPVHLLQIRLAQRPVAPTLQARSDGAQRIL